MKRWRVRFMVFVSAAAVAVAAIDVIGWLAWRGKVHALSIQPAAAGDVFAGSFMSLPSVVVRTRRLRARELESMPTENLAAVVARIGRSQRRWLPADGSGFVNLAREQLAQGRVQESIDALSDALVRNPTSPSLHRLRALFLFSAGDRGAALGELAIAEAIAPGFRKPPVELTNQDEESVALDGLRVRCEIYPRQRTETSLALARVLRAKGDQAAANDILAEFRGRPEVEIELARWAIEAGEFDAAIQKLLPIASRRANPRAMRARAWSEIATAQDLNGDSGRASSAADEALRLDPDSTATYVTLARLAQSRGDLDSALSHLRKAWGMQPRDTRLLTKIASVAEQAGKPADALLALERAVEIDPGAPRFAAALVRLQLRTGRYTEATLSLSRALDRHPADPELLRLADQLSREVGIR